MRSKELINKKLEQVSNALMYLNSQISSTRDPREMKQTITAINEKLEEIQTLINAETNSWQ